MQVCTDRRSDRWRPRDRGRSDSSTGRLAITLAVLGALVASAGCSGSSDGTGGDPAPAEPSPTQVEQLQVDGQDAVAVVPAKAERRGLVVYLHGVDDDAGAILGDDKRVTLVQRLAADGYVVVSSDAHLNAWGNPASQEDYVALAAEAAQRYGTSDTFLVAESMGGAAGLQILAGDRIPDLAGLAGISPLVDLEAAVREGQEASLREAYDGDLPSGEENPVNLPAEAFAVEHLRLYVAPDDDVVVTSENADVLADRIGDVADVTEVGCEGGHVDESCFQPDDLADWFDGLLAERGGG